MRYELADYQGGRPRRLLIVDYVRDAWGQIHAYGRPDEDSVFS